MCKKMFGSYLASPLFESPKLPVDPPHPPFPKEEAGEAEVEGMSSTLVEFALSSAMTMGIVL